MTIQVDIPEPLAGKVKEAAERAGKAPADVVLEAVAHRMAPFAELDRQLAPVYARMEALGLTEEDAALDFDVEKHALRREREAGGR